MLFGLGSSVASAFPVSEAGAEDEMKMVSVVDEINSYSSLYPSGSPSKIFVFKWVESRKPERYSSAAPLSHRSPNPVFLKTKDKSTWNAKDIADSVLSDKSALRVNSGQKMAESSILHACTSEIDGETYWFYEYLIRKSPTKSVADSNIFRHYVASSAEHDGYLYSLNASTLSKQWDAASLILFSLYIYIYI